MYSCVIKYSDVWGELTAYAGFYQITSRPDRNHNLFNEVHVYQRARRKADDETPAVRILPYDETVI